jgi:hypothetical protein
MFSDLIASAFSWPLSLAFLNLRESSKFSALHFVELVHQCALEKRGGIQIGCPGDPKDPSGSEGVGYSVLAARGWIREVRTLDRTLRLAGSGEIPVKPSNLVVFHLYCHPEREVHKPEEEGWFLARIRAAEHQTCKILICGTLRRFLPGTTTQRRRQLIDLAKPEVLAQSHNRPRYSVEPLQR